MLQRVGCKLMQDEAEVLSCGRRQQHLAPRDIGLSYKPRELGFDDRAQRRDRLVAEDRLGQCQRLERADELARGSLRSARA